MYGLDEKMLIENRTLISINKILNDIDYNSKIGTINYVQDTDDLYLFNASARQQKLEGKEYKDFLNKLMQVFPNNELRGTFNFKDSQTFKGNVLIQGNLDVKGSTTNILSTNASIKDNLVELNQGQTGSTISLGKAGVAINRGSNFLRLLFDENTKAFLFDKSTLIDDVIDPINAPFKAYIEDYGLRKAGDVDIKETLYSNNLIVKIKTTTDSFAANTGVINTLTAGAFTVNNNSIFNGESRFKNVVYAEQNIIGTKRFKADSLEAITEILGPKLTTTDLFSTNATLSKLIVDSLIIDSDVNGKPTITFGTNKLTLNDERIDLTKQMYVNNIKVLLQGDKILTADISDYHAADINHTHTTILSSGRAVCDLTGTSLINPGFSMQEAYSNGYPINYGNIFNMKGKDAAGTTQLLLGWSGNSTITQGYHEDNFIRSKRDGSDGNSKWSDWAKIWTSANLDPSIYSLKTDIGKPIKSLSYTKNNTNYKLGTYDINTTGSIVLSVKYYISNKMGTLTCTLSPNGVGQGMYYGIDNYDIKPSVKTRIEGTKIEVYLTIPTGISSVIVENIYDNDRKFTVINTECSSISTTGITFDSLNNYYNLGADLYIKNDKVATEFNYVPVKIDTVEPSIKTNNLWIEKKSSSDVAIDFTLNNMIFVDLD